MTRKCPLCGSGSAQLDLTAAGFLARVNKSAAILRLIRDVGPVGLTHEEVSKVLKFSHATVSARLHDLQHHNEISAAGKRQTASGRLATVFVAVAPHEADTAQLTPEAA